MKPVQFLSNSAQIANIIKGLTLTKSLFVSSILIGERYTGKKTLIKTLFPNTIYVDASNENELNRALESYDEVVIYNFETLNNIESLNFENKRIIAIANHVHNSALIARRFAFIYQMPSLLERSEDIEMLTTYFCSHTKKELMIDLEVELDLEHIDLSENIKSLKASIYKQIVTNSLTEEDIERILYTYLYKKIEGNNAYREHLGIYEKPLIQAGLKKFKSQLKLSAILGLNRNTLRKKIHEYDFD